MPALSVVVPVYNVEGYLDWCLDSLLDQTLGDIEIICVNDGSTDGSRDVLGRRAQLDSRIRIIDKENGGLSSARNAGILNASAPYVCFLDSDDRFTPNACEVIVRAFGESRADVVTFGANCFPSAEGNAWIEEHLSPRDAVYEPFHPDLLFKEMSRPFAWRTACRAAFLKEHGILFDESVKFGEDQVFHFAVYPRASKTVLLSDKLYDYRIAREGSLMATVVSDLYVKGMEHIPISDAVLADWKATGLLRRYSSEMLAWVVDFNLYEMLSLPVDKASEVFDAVGRLVLRYWDKEELAGLSIPKHVRRVLDPCFSNEGRTSAGFAKRKLSYRLHEDGARKTVSSIVGYARRLV